MFTWGFLVVAVHNKFQMRISLHCCNPTHCPNCLKDDSFVKEEFCTNGSYWTGMIFMLRCCEKKRIKTRQVVCPIKINRKKMSRTLPLTLYSKQLLTWKPFSICLIFFLHIFMIDCHLKSMIGCNSCSKIPFLNIESQWYSNIKKFKKYNFISQNSAEKMLNLI